MTSKKNNRKRKSMYLGSTYCSTKSNLLETPRTNQSCLNQSFDQSNRKYDPFIRSLVPEHRIPDQYNILVGSTKEDVKRVKSPYKC